jgi:predicted RNA-binding Zn-ribbon protein involved in translation (DUF1610 family)/ribosomal protein S27E
MDLTIEQSCPSCGAPIELHEADRLIRCPFCDVGNYLVAAEGTARFVLPDKAPDRIAREDVIYAPYLRLKGNIFSCQGKQVDHKVIDTTHRGMNIPNLPVSLGLRPQAMKIFPVTAGIVGRFFPQAETMTTVFAKATELAAIFSKENNEPLYHRAFIGETISCIYLPLYLEGDFVYDAVLNRSLGERKALTGLAQQAKRYHPSWTPRFLATLCPHCAETLEGEHDSLVLSCPNCASLWAEKDGAFHPVRWQIIRAEGDNAIYLPFWRIRPTATGVSLSSFGDFLRLTNQPVVVRREHEALELCFWVPAFKIRPNLFLQLAKSMTISQAKIPDGGTDMVKMMYPVTLPSSEALQSLKTILADITMDKRHFLPELPGIKFQARQTDLVYLPFTFCGHDLVQEQTSISVASTVLHFGRSL